MISSLISNLRLVAVLSLACLSGCGPKTGTVTGKVHFDKDVLHSGTVAFRSADGQIASTQILEGGDYEVKNLGLGAAQITVQTFQPSPAVVPPDTPPSSIKIPSHRFQPIPEKYREFPTSGLTHEVVAGPQHLDIRLTK